MKWREDFATGVKRIDEQHKMLFAMAEDFRLALESGTGGRVYENLLDSLDLYSRTHFGFEERCMAEFQCPMAGRNAQAHARFIELLAGVRRRYAVTGYAADDARELVETLDQWLTGHICGIDVHLREYAPPED